MLQNETCVRAKAILFDFDGTLFDSMHIWKTIGIDYLHSIGYVPREETREALRTLSIAQSAAYFIREYGVSFSEAEIIEEIDRMLERFYFEEAPPRPGVDTFLEGLYTRGVRMCVATATDGYLIEAALKRTDLRKYFVGVYTCADVGRGKQEPDLYEYALAALGVPKEEAVVFEDALYAARTAKRAGFFTIGIQDRHEPEQAALAALADLYLRDYAGAMAAFGLA